MTEVVAALIWEGDRFLICQRPAHKARGLLWEFVGGKVEPGETGEQALIRECREELGIQVSVGDVFMEVVHEYPDLTVHLVLYHAAIAAGVPQRLEHHDLRMISVEEIPDYDFCPADVEILARLRETYGQGRRREAAGAGGRTMKFSEMPYQRPDLEAVKEELAALNSHLAGAGSYAAARAVFLEREQAERRLSTLETLANIRHTIDTRDPFYDGEMKFWNAAGPELQEYRQGWTRALLDSPYREDFAGEFGEVMFLNGEIALRTFAPALIPLLQQENDLTQEYEKLLASAQIPFEDGVYTLSQMSPMKNDPDDARRLAAWQAEGRWYKEHQPALDELYHKLVGLRDEMGRRLGYQNYVPLGYDRMNRSCYTKEDVERFRSAVVKYLVPVADGIYREQARRLGKEYPLSFADAALQFRSGNPRPAGTPQEILAHGQTFYDELSPETGAFYRMMREMELMDVLSTEGKAGGGYCTGLYEYGVPFILANFNGTQGDVEVITHEAGHAFAAWLNRDRLPVETIWPSLEGCEVHSMSMEFFAWPWAEGFFGGDTRKFYYSHLSGALTFIPYGTMVDHFQHIVYERPELTPAQRHGVWKELLGDYMPWMKLDGEIPFYGEGEGWQRQHHIYSSPFYYIDYCLAQTVSLQFWALIQKDPKAAWERYMAYTRQGGSKPFTALLENAGLVSPFEESCLREVCAAAKGWLEEYDLSGIR